METFFWTLNSSLIGTFLSYLWGMETCKDKQRSIRSFLFLSYLWGMETKRGRLLSLFILPVLILPMRNGNLIKISPPLSFFGFLSYLWGMETFKGYICCLNTGIVLILPMRNGNKYKDDIIRMKIKSSYPTYEEWKLKENLESNWLKLTVLILPMRNGNLLLFPSGKAPKHVLILPMRNGNSSS